VSGETGAKKDFFISYNHNDEAWALWINVVLEKAGYTTIIQARDFLAGSNFIMEMQRAIINSDRTIAIFSKNYSESDFCSSEWSAALVSDPAALRSKLIPVRVDLSYEPLGLLKPIRFIDLVKIDLEDIAKDEKAQKARECF
jgi:hypothetical protein